MRDNHKVSRRGFIETAGVATSAVMAAGAFPHPAVGSVKGANEKINIAILGPGEIVGEMSFVDARPPSATVKALEDSTVFSLSKPRLNAKLAADPGFSVTRSEMRRFFCRPSSVELSAIASSWP